MVKDFNRPACEINKLRANVYECHIAVPFTRDRLIENNKNKLLYVTVRVIYSTSFQTYRTYRVRVYNNTNNNNSIRTRIFA